MNQILLDAIANITMHNGVMRIECTAVGPDGKQHPSGVMLIPGAVAGPVLQGLVTGMQELEKKIREQQQAQQTMPPAGHG